MIISFSGGLGNQMFQYAYYFSQKKRHPEITVLADVSSYEVCATHNGYELNKIFGIVLDVCNSETSSTHRMTNTLLDRLLRKCGIYYAGYHYTVRDKAKGFEKRFLDKYSNEDYLYGFWQSEKYFEPYKEQIKDVFQFSQYTNENNKMVASKMRSTNSIAIHVRRGDYLKNKMYVNLAETDYYEKAIDKIKKNEIGKKTWFIFSDDIEWCKTNLKLAGEDVQYVTGNVGNESYRDMQLMTECKYVIVANSSFSWWGAYLNRNANLIVAPKEYYVRNSGFNKDICPDNWIRI